ncbi:hypothetical protein EVAR_92275_1 [Eumeta japonica]|uniref:Uncharacterized protein n=1 Tax=Eumeta variegata TaxID=151549 RepID=A0A4C1TNA3_EUMVA|nr:hypothetical protein EVAR_92275_1 [Eumeta japonica]
MTSSSKRITASGCFVAGARPIRGTSSLTQESISFGSERCGLKIDTATKVEEGILRGFGYLKKKNENRLTKQMCKVNMEMLEFEAAHSGSLRVGPANERSRSIAGRMYGVRKRLSHFKKRGASGF